mgnify:FL=1
MNDPIIEKAVALKKELEGVSNPEIQGHMDEIMKLVLGAVIVRCGSCKATGIEHKWNDKGDLLPTGNRCPSCGGTGAAKTS